MPDNVREQHRVRRGGAARRALFSGSSASIFSTIALSICSRIDSGSYVAGINGPSQWLWGEAEAHTREASVRHTVVGYSIHHLTSVFWAIWHELAFNQDTSRHKSPTRRCAEAAVTSAGAYVVDYYLTPPRLRPGFKKHIRTPSMFVVYGAFALGLAAACIVRDRRR